MEAWLTWEQARRDCHSIASAERAGYSWALFLGDVSQWKRMHDPGRIGCAVSELGELHGGGLHWQRLGRGTQTNRGAVKRATRRAIDRSCSASSSNLPAANALWIIHTDFYALEPCNGRYRDMRRGGHSCTRLHQTAVSGTACDSATLTTHPNVMTQPNLRGPTFSTSENARKQLRFRRNSRLQVEPAMADLSLLPKLRNLRVLTAGASD